mmetsp:Transcript_25300/g.38840  ORF Transcript_25300/g.38840 Transcript_25300/m.38840 type:complete len:263 (-) Transcript_25300:705-1493(-)
MTNSVRFFPALRINSWDSLGFLDHLDMRLDCLVDNIVRIIRLPFPFFANRILVMPPAENALVGAGQTWSGFHALIGGNTVKGVLVASTSSSQLMLGPSAKLDSTVGANQFVPLLLQCSRLRRSNHFSWFYGSVVVFSICITHCSFHGRSHIFHIHNLGLFVVLRILIIVAVIRNDLGKDIVMDPSLQDPILIAHGVVSDANLLSKDVGAQFAKCLKGLLGRFSHAVVSVIRTSHSQNSYLQLSLQGMFRNPKIVFQILQGRF